MIYIGITGMLENEKMSDMTVEVKLYGKLRDKVNSKSVESSEGRPSSLDFELGNAKTVGDILSSLGIGEEEISHIFVNGDYSGINKEIMDGDSVAIFPRDMGLLYKWYFSKSGSKNSK